VRSRSSWRRTSHPREHDPHDYGAISGVGAAQRFSAVRWGVARGIVLAWIATISGSGRHRWLSYLLLRAIV